MMMKFTAMGAISLAWRIVAAAVVMSLATAHELSGDESDSPAARAKIPPPPAAAAPAPKWARVSVRQTTEAKALGIPVAFEGAAGIRFVLIPSGRFQMGSDAPVAGGVRDHDETSHSVAISNAFYIAITETTNRSMRLANPQRRSPAFMDTHSIGGDDQPAGYVGWSEVGSFVEWLRKRDPDTAYRLPTEAEWEYACRAGTTSKWFWGDEASEFPRFANLFDESAARLLGGQPVPAVRDRFDVSAPVATFEPNAWGLYDMAGNVSEWCADWEGPFTADSVVDPSGPASGRGRVVRGGAWSTDVGMARSSARAWMSTSSDRGVAPMQGFRLAVTARRP